MARRAVPALALAATLALAGCGEHEAPAEQDPNWASEAERDNITLQLQDAEGSDVGAIEIAERRTGTRVLIEADGLPPGSHAVRFQSGGSCGIGGRVSGGELLMTLETDSEGAASGEVVTDLFSADDLRQEGSAFVVGSGRQVACAEVEQES